MEVADFLTSKSEIKCFFLWIFSCSSSKLIDVINSASVFTSPIQLTVIEKLLIEVLNMDLMV